MNKFDEIDMKILRELVIDAGQSVPKLSKKIQVNPSVTYSRIKRLSKKGLIKNFTVEVNEDLLGWKVLAYVGVNSDAKETGLRPEGSSWTKMRCARSPK